MNTIERLAWWIWETSLTASWAMLIALPLLLIFRKPPFAQVRYWIGLLVIARLLFPISFQSELSVQTYVPAAAAAAVEVAYEAPVYLDATSPEPTLIFPLIWLTGALLLAARVLVQQWRVRGWIRAGELVTLEALDEARRLMSVRRKVAVYVVPQIATPALCGLFRPKLLLPPSALSHAKLRLVFLHELAHVRRWDVLAKWAMIVARAVYWFNPLVWLVTRRMSADQELLCDAAALQALNRDEQKSYGETLLALASESRPAAATLLPISGNFKQMKERIAMITQFKPTTRRGVFLAAAIAAVFSFLTFTRAVEKVEPPNAEKAAKTSPEGPRGERDERTLNALREEFKKLTDRIEYHERELDEYRSKLGITGPLSNEDALPVSEKIGTMERERLRIEQEASKARQTLVTLKKSKTPEKTRVAVSLAYPNDERLNRFLADLGQIEKQFTIAREEYSGDHPEIKRLVALMKNINQVIDTHIEGILLGLETVVSSQEEQLAKIDEMVAKARAQDAELRRSVRPYFNVKRDIETMRAVRDSLHARLLQTEIESRVAKAGE